MTRAQAQAASEYSTHSVPGLAELAIYKHGPRLWYVVDLVCSREIGRQSIIGMPSDTLTAAIAYAMYRADIGGYR